MKVETPREQIMFSTVRINCTLATGTSVGTGFLFDHPAGEGQHIPLLVTNKHVIQGATEIRFHFAAADGDKPMLGESTSTITSSLDDWFGHPDPTIDLAALPIAPVLTKLEAAGEKPFTRRLPSEIIPDADALEDLDAIEDVVFVGYPSGLFDEANLTPIARSGTLATPACLDYGGRPVFLIDASVFPGSSGSPVFISNHGTYFTRGATQVGNRLLLLGVVAQVIQKKETGQLEIAEVPTRAVPVPTTMQSIDLGVVFHARLISELGQGILDKSIEKGNITLEVPQ